MCDPRVFSCRLGGEYYLKEVEEEVKKIQAIPGETDIP